MSMQSSLDKFRVSIEKRERQSANRMVRAYGLAYTRLLTLYGAFMERVTAYRDENKNDPTPAWIYEEQRFVSLLNQTEAELTIFAQYADREITASQLVAVNTALNNSSTLIVEALKEDKAASIPAEAELAQKAFTQLHTQAVEKMVGQTGDGTPLSKLLNKIAPETKQKVKDTLVNSIVTGDNPRETATKLRETMGTSLTKSLTISRTEVLRSYRNAAIENYQINKDVIKGWQWNASRSARTCIMCIGMDGKVFPLDVMFGSHPNCRCSPSPVTKDYKETLKTDADIPDNPASSRQTGAEWFNTLTSEEQRRMLGPGKYDLWASGEVKDIRDFIGYKVDPEWGVVRWERSIKAIREGTYAEPAISDIPRIRMAKPHKKAA